MVLTWTRGSGFRRRGWRSGRLGRVVQGQEGDLAGASVRSSQKLAFMDDAGAYACPDSDHSEGP